MRNTKTKNPAQIQQRRRRRLIIASVVFLLGASVWVHYPGILHKFDLNNNGLQVHTRIVSAKPLTTAPAPTVQTTTENQTMPYGTTTVYSSSLPAGTKQITRQGVEGVNTLTYQTSTINGKQNHRQFINATVTKQPVDEIITVGTNTALKTPGST